MFLSKNDTRTTTYEEMVHAVCAGFHEKNFKYNGITLYKFTDDEHSVTFIYGTKMMMFQYVDFIDEPKIKVYTDNFVEVFTIYEDRAEMYYIEKNQVEMKEITIPLETFNEVDYFQYEVLGVTSLINTPELIKLKDKTKDLLDAIV